MPDKQTPNLRERTRRAVQREITETAARLVLEHGYDATTIEDIAAETGMSARSVFRYFPTKEDLIVGTLDTDADPLLEALRGRPQEEPVWISLRRMFDALASGAGIPGGQELPGPISRVIFETPALLARYLQQLQLVQDRVEQVIRERASATGTTYADDDPTPGAIAGAAFGCLLSAQHAWLNTGTPDALATTLDRAMSALCPTAEINVPDLA